MKPEYRADLAHNSQENAAQKLRNALTEIEPEKLIAQGIKDLCLAEMRDGHPDYRARKDGIQMLRDTYIGTPVQYQHTLIETRGPDSARVLEDRDTMAALAKAMASTPEGRAALQAEADTIDI